MARFSHWRRQLNARLVQFALWLVRLAGRSRSRYRPLVRAEFAEGDYLSQARFLHRAGYHKAAVCLSRVAVEDRLLRFALVLPNWRELNAQRAGISHLNCVLKREGVIRSEHSHLLQRFAEKAK